MKTHFITTVFATVWLAAIFVQDATGQASLYWTDTRQGAIYRTDVDGGATELILSATSSPIADPQYLALDEPGGKMYWIESKAIRRANLDGSVVENLVSNEDVGWGVEFYPKGLALDLLHQKMYWSTWDGWFPGTHGRGLHRADLDGQNIESLSAGAAMGIAVDPVNGKMYWCGGDWMKQLIRASLDGSDPEVIPGGATTEIVLDMDSGWYYYIFSGGASGGEPLSIHRASLDGAASFEDLISGGSPRGLTLDSGTGKMYWATSARSIRRANLDGSGIETIASFEDVSIGDMVITAGVQETATATETGTQLPGTHVLSPAYPNPFNPSTTIRYTLASSVRISIKVRDALGQIVDVLVDEVRPAGTHQVTWAAESDTPSGVYFYTLETGSGALTRSMLLLK